MYNHLFQIFKSLCPNLNYNLYLNNNNCQRISIFNNLVNIFYFSLIIDELSIKSEETNNISDQYYE